MGHLPQTEPSLWAAGPSSDPYLPSLTVGLGSMSSGVLCLLRPCGPTTEDPLAWQEL